MALASLGPRTWALAAVKVTAWCDLGGPSLWVLVRAVVGGEWLVLGPEGSAGPRSLNPPGIESHI